MKIFVWIAFVAFASSAVAGDVIVTFDAAGTMPETTVTPFTPIDVYIIGQEAGSMVGWALGITVSPAYTLTGRTLPFGDGPQLGIVEPNYLVALGGCFGTPGEDTLFIQLEIGYFAGAAVPQDELVCVQPYPEGPTAGLLSYTDCDDQVVEMSSGNIGCTPTTDGCAILNPASLCVIETQRTSWSSIKGSY